MKQTSSAKQVILPQQPYKFCMAAANENRKDESKNQRNLQDGYKEAERHNIHFEMA